MLNSTQPTEAEIYALLAEDDRHPTKAETEATEETTYDEGPAEDASPPPPATWPVTPDLSCGN